MRSNLLRASAHRKQGRGTRQLFAEVARRHSPSGAIGHDTSGHLWQGRFKAFPIQRDDHLLTVVRYVERNPLRAGLVARAEDWRWSSLAAAQLEAVRHSVNRGTPFGTDRWVPRTARRLGLESTLRPRGRPRKPAKKLNDTFFAGEGVAAPPRRR